MVQVKRNFSLTGQRVWFLGMVHADRMLRGRILYYVQYPMHRLYVIQANDGRTPYVRREEFVQLP